MALTGRLFAARRLITLATLPLAAALTAPATAHAQGALDPVIFVHGYSGSGEQFESQKLRFVENGYPDGYVQVLEYDSTPATPIPGTTGLDPVGVQAIEAQLFPRLDQLIAQLKASTGRPQVELLAHSLGTTLMQDYLKSSPARAANVASYVNIDGRTASSPPGGVRTLALWATKGPLSPPGRSITGATNVTIPDSTHVQAATSPVSFAAIYKFFTGAAPATTDIVPQSGTITLSGKALLFPNNTGMTGATVQLWPVDDATGQRTSTTPIASYQIGPGGDFGPVAVQSGRRYEFTLIRPGVPVHHYYYEPFLRSDHLIRLLESDALRLAGGPPSPRSVAMVVIRYKELWGDQGAEDDIVHFNGVNICNPVICPISQLVNAIFAYDRGQDGKTNTSQRDPVYARITFVTGVDIFMPAQNPPVGKVTVTLQSRGTGPVRTVTFPNFPSTTDVTTVQLNDFEQSVAASSPAATPTGCVRRNRFTLHVHQPRRGRIVRVDLYVDGHRVKRVHGRRITGITLRRPAGRNDFRVVVVAWSANGGRTVTVQRFHRCGRSAPRVRRHHHTRRSPSFTG